MSICLPSKLDSSCLSLSSAYVSQSPHSLSPSTTHSHITQLKTPKNTHTYPQHHRYRSAACVSICLGGVTTKHELPYPFDCSSPLPYPLVGDTDPQHQTPGVQSSFCGEMGALYFFRDGLTTSHLKGIYKLGAGYCELFTRNGSNGTGVGSTGGSGIGSNGTDSGQISEDEDVNRVFSGAVSPLLMLVLNPSIYKGKFLTNIAPEGKYSWCKDRMPECDIDM